MPLEERPLGRTGLRVSALGFGCGAIGGLFVRGDAAEQRQALEEAIAAGITYFDTAPSYGDGQSEDNLGRALAETGANVVVGTKVRLEPSDLADVSTAVERSLATSLRRLRRERVDLLQLHTQVVLGPGRPDGAVTFDDVVGPIADALQAARVSGQVGHVGFTGLGDTQAVARVVESGRLETVQAYFNALNPSAGWPGRARPGTQDFAGLIDRAAAAGLGIIGIRPLAAGALSATDQRHPNAGDPGFALVAGNDYTADLRQAQRIVALAAEAGLEGPVELALRFALAKPGVSTVIVGFSDLPQLRAALRWANRGPLDPTLVDATIAAAAA
jgi:L-galactose dehydrogenase/L-glyceraldehyde 3-phosphate reductase